MTDTALRSPAAQIEALTGIRGVAAVWVALLHFQWFRPNGLLGLPGIREVTRDGWLAVDFFFVLSGFIMMHVHGRDFATRTVGAARRFFALRFIRIYPAHVAVLLLHIPLLLAGLYFGAVFDRAAFAPKSFLFSFVMLNGWGLPGSDGWNVPSWSVSSEWFAYLMFPVIASFVAKVESRRIALYVALSVLATASILGGVVSGWKLFMLPFEGTLFRVTSEFCLGCLAYSFYSRPIGPTVAEAAAEIALATILIISLVSLPQTANVVTLAAFVVLVVGLSQARGRAARLLQTKAMVYLGRISYSAYIVHALVLTVYSRALRHIGDNVGWTIEAMLVLGYALAVIASAHLLYHTVEEPSRRWLRSLAHRDAAQRR